ncbi:MAG: AI-2E family transporter [Herminiimonas sp.]|nr:AI-2E family transporter [Herminiimonas sp.]
MKSSRPVDKIKIASYVLSALALLLILIKGLLVALLAGLLVYSLVHLIAPRLGRKLSNRRARIVAIAALGIVIVAALSAVIWGAVAFFQSDAGSVHRLLRRLADILETSRDQIPDWMRNHLPTDVDQMRLMISEWLRLHAIEAKVVGERAGRIALHLLLGMIIGAMVALYDSTSIEHVRRPLAAALRERLLQLHAAFQQIVFAQVQIAAINAALMALYLLVILPMAGINLPLTKSMIVITFMAGLIPVAGNLISNTILVVVALSHSVHTAAASLLFMVVIHKLEYFLNARIVGAKIQASAWELLVAILVMETLFGLPGLVAAPVFYAYLKRELIDLDLI